MYKVSKMINN